MSLTREDVLRELELLPVWQLRAPAIVKVEQAEVPQAIEQETAQNQAQIRLIESDDSNYLFILLPSQNANEEALLQNMLKSIACKPRMDIASQSIDKLAQYTPKVIVAMGEAAAYALLNVTESLENMRGKLHESQHIPVVVTYHPSQLLLNAADKAKAWQDLCLARGQIK